MKFYYKIGFVLSLFISSLCFSSIASFAEDCNRGTLDTAYCDRNFDQVADLKPGDTVAPNTFIGTQGRSGSTTGAHVSFDFYQKGTNIPDTEARDWFLKTHLR